MRICPEEMKSLTVLWKFAEKRDFAQRIASAKSSKRQIQAETGGMHMVITRLVVIVMTAGIALAAEVSSSPVTFNKHVLPILQKKCQGCHRPGQMGPMSFLTYKEARPWAKAIKSAVVARKMPPWFADPQHGTFSNDPSLTTSQIETIVKWVEAGAQEGYQNDAPRPVRWPDGWVIEPDIVVQGSTTDVPAHTKNDVMEWMQVIVPSGFTADTWITSVQIRPSHPGVVHHICAMFIPHSPDVQYNVSEWQEKERDGDGSALPGKKPTFGGRRAFAENTGNDCYVPGNIAADYRPFEAAKLVRAGSDIVLNLHYTPNGKAVSDRVQLGYTVAKEPPQRRYVSLSHTAPTNPKLFAIPPNDPNWQSPPAEATFNEDVELVFMMPHMHSRGKDMTYTLDYPDGRKEIALHVPRYDFNWQLGYYTSIQVPKGTKLRVDAHFDNSRNNPANPNPDRTVYYGEMTWEEMMLPFFGVVVDKGVDLKKIITKQEANGSGA